MTSDPYRQTRRCQNWRDQSKRRARQGERSFIADHVASLDSEELDFWGFIDRECATDPWLCGLYDFADPVEVPSPLATIGDALTL